MVHEKAEFFSKEITIMATIVEVFRQKMLFVWDISVHMLPAFCIRVIGADEAVEKAVPSDLELRTCLIRDEKVVLILTLVKFQENLLVRS